MTVNQDDSQEEEHWRASAPLSDASADELQLSTSNVLTDEPVMRRVNSAKGNNMFGHIVYLLGRLAHHWDAPSFSFSKYNSIEAGGSKKYTYSTSDREIPSIGLYTE